VTNGLCVSLSLACKTTSVHAKDVPCNAALVARMCSSDVYIAWSNLGIKQCKVASSLAPSERLSYSTRNIKLSELSLANGLNPK
jgi:hypothetical protein